MKEQERYFFDPRSLTGRKKQTRQDMETRYAQEGGNVSKINIGSVTTASVTSRFTWMKFKMAPNG